MTTRIHRRHEPPAVDRVDNFEQAAVIAIDVEDRTAIKRISTYVLHVMMPRMKGLDTVR